MPILAAWSGSFFFFLNSCQRETFNRVLYNDTISNEFHILHEALLDIHSQLNCEVQIFRKKILNPQILRIDSLNKFINSSTATL